LGVALLRTDAKVLATVVMMMAPALAAALSPPVTRVVVRSERAVDLDDIRPLVAIEIGKPLDTEQVRRTLRNLRLGELAAQVEVYQRAVEGGIEIDLVLRPDVVVEKVSIEGASGVPDATLLAAVPQKAGQPLREDRMVRGVYRIEEALAAEGWLDAVARLEVATGENPRSVRAIYHVEPGERVSVGEIHIDGLGSIDAGQASAALRLRPGDPYRAAVAREDTDRLARFLVRSDFRLAQVARVETTRRPGTATIDLAWKVELGPRFAFELVGAERKTLERRDLLPFLGDSGFDEALLQQSLAQIRRDYQERGYYRVDVKESRSEDEGVLRLRLEVVPGARYVLDGIRFVGNDSFPSQRLERLLATSPRRVLQLERGRLVDEVLNEDLSNLRSFYALDGFDRARIGPPRVEETASRHLRLTIPIAEGARRTVGQLSIEGLRVLDVGQLVRTLPLRVDGPFHRLLLESSVDEIRSRLEALGYRAALVEPDVEWDEASRVAKVSFRVLEGERSAVEAVLVRGNTRTRTSVIRRFAGLEPGDPISTERLLNVQQALYKLGIFSSVAVSVPTTDAEFAAREVLIDVEEGRTRGIAYGAGYDSEAGARGLLRFSHSNLGGRAAVVQLDALVAQRDQLYRALFSQPYLWHWPVEVKGTVYKQLENRPTFDVARRGAQLGFERPLGSLRLGLYFEYRLVKLESSVSDSVVPRESRDARVASLTPTLLWDHRDDPIDPTRGWSVSLSAERAAPLSAADADYLKLFAQWTDFVPFAGGTIAGSIRAGRIQPFGTSTDPALRPIDLVPAAELFYAGGRTTHRAFARDELGIPGQTLFVEPGKSPVPLGGGGLGLINLEYRFPIAGALGGTLFADGGNVWREASQINLHEMRWGAGVGIRYASPIGPLRLEVGWKLDRKSYEDAYVAFISLGNAF